MRLIRLLNTAVFLVKRRQSRWFFLLNVVNATVFLVKRRYRYCFSKETLSTTLVFRFLTVNAALFVRLKAVEAAFFPVYRRQRLQSFPHERLQRGDFSVSTPLTQLFFQFDPFNAFVFPVKR